MEEGSAIHKNFLALQAHSNATRKLVRDYEEMLEELKKENTGIKNELALLKSQVQAIQVKLFSGGKTSP